MRQIRGQRQRYGDEVYELAEQLLSSGSQPPTATAIRAALDDNLPGIDIPTERAIRDWIQKGVIRRRTDLWTIGASEPGEAAAVLPVLSAVAIRNRRVGRAIGRHIPPPLLGRDEALIVVRLTEAAPLLAPVTRFEIARLYASWARAGFSTVTLDIFIGHLVAFEAWTVEGRQRLEKSLASGEIEPTMLRFSPGTDTETTALAVAIDQGIQAHLKQEGEK